MENFRSFISALAISSNDLAQLCTIPIKRTGVPGETLQGFADGWIACPWIEYWCRLHEKTTNLDGILLMQDWWECCPKAPRLEDNVDYIAQCIDNPENARNDRTTKNLMRTGFREHIKSGRWLVTNAVWGLRPSGSGTCGRLRAALHRISFRVWSSVVVHFAKQPSFKLFVAGSWAKVNETAHGRERIGDYLKAWSDWANHPVQDLRRVQGCCYFWPHPSKWAASFDPLDI